MSETFEEKCPECGAPLIYGVNLAFCSALACHYNREINGKKEGWKYE